MTEKIQDILNSYSAAYQAANDKPAPIVLYAAGWFTLQGRKYRRWQLTRMRNELIERASQHPLQHHCEGQS